MGIFYLLPIMLNTYPYIIINKLQKGDHMAKLTIDERRRITLPKDLINSWDVFFAVRTEEGILLKPLEKNPVDELSKQGKKLPKGITLNKLKKAAQEEAQKEANMR
jgi:hypothetical protein